jgi:hypothetical protein
MKPPREREVQKSDSGYGLRAANPFASQTAIIVALALLFGDEADDAQPAAKNPAGQPESM